jgi:Tfp pilus assembly protein PilF
MSAQAKGRGWGGVARRGAGVLGEDKEHAGTKDTSASKIWRDAVQRARGEVAGDDERWEPERVVEVDVDDAPTRRPARRGAGADAARLGATARSPRGRAATRDRTPAKDRARVAAPKLRPKKEKVDRLPADVARDVNRTGGESAQRVASRLAEATQAYERDRYDDARRTLRGLVELAPDLGPARELYGLTLYRLGRWAAAIKELEAFHHLTASYDQHPVLADCYRALKRLKHVERVWDEMRRGGVGADVMAEGRIVVAGAYADSGDVTRAIALLERASVDVRHPKLHHLRVWYALADLYERAGDVPHARALFLRVREHDVEFHDVDERLRGLR